MGVMQTTGINANIKATQEFIIDTAADANDLPVGAYPGSSALCIETGDVYVLGTNREWSVIGGGSGSGGSDSDGGNGMIINVDKQGEVYTLDKTWGEISSHLKSCGTAIVICEYETEGDEGEYYAKNTVSVVTGAQMEHNRSNDGDEIYYYIYVESRLGIPGMFECGSEDEYPSYDWS